MAKTMQNGERTLTEHVAPAHRVTSIMFDGRSSATVREVVEDHARVFGRLLWLGARLTIRPALSIGSHMANAPWPWGLVDFAARAVAPVPGSVVRRFGCRIAPRDGPCCRCSACRRQPARRVVHARWRLLTCGVNTHDRLVTTLSKYADTPVLVMNYRMMPKHSIREAFDDCYDGYQWLRGQGYEPDQIVLAGDSAEGYLSLTLAERLLNEGEELAAIVCMSPLMQIAKRHEQVHPNIRSDAMFSADAFDAFAT